MRNCSVIRLILLVVLVNYAFGLILVFGHFKQVTFKYANLLPYLFLDTLVHFHVVQLGFDSLVVKLRQHQKFILELSNIERFHLVQHLFHGFEREELKNIRYLVQMLLNFAIIVTHKTALFADNTCHYVGENAKLVEITDFDSQFESFDDLVLVQFKNQRYSFHGVAEELRKVIIEMLIEENQVFVKIIVQTIEIEENLLKILFDQSNYPYQFDIAQSRDNVVCN
jgi:hypothetical protein